MTQGKIEPQARERKVLPIFVTKVDEAQGIVEAVVNVFGIIDLGDDIIHNGAYTKTLNERGNKIRVKVLDSHNTDSVLRVVGKPLEIREIGRDELGQVAPQVLENHPEATGGLYTRTQYLLDTPEGMGVFKRIVSGAVDEYSIALDALQVDYGKATRPDGKEVTVRNIRALRLWEYSAVIWGMNQATTTTDVKQAEEHPQPDAEEAKGASLGVCLEAGLRTEYAYVVNSWLRQGWIELADLDALDTAFRDAINALRAALPEMTGMPQGTYGSKPAAETKAGTLGAYLEAYLRREFNWLVTYWLQEGVIDGPLVDALNEALKGAMDVLRAAIPGDLAGQMVRDYYDDYWAAREAEETKAGRVISAGNLEYIQQAITALQALLDAAGTESADEANADEKASTGPDGQPSQAPLGQTVTEPSIATSDEDDVDTAAIERELAELDVMMEMAP